VLDWQGRVLVVSQHGTSWSLPKGHIDPGESELSAAKREIEEESGIKQQALELVRELGTYSRYKIGRLGGEDKTELKTITMFLFRLKREEGDNESRVLRPTDPENPEARFVEKDKVAAFLTHPKDRGFFESIMREI